jgi:hypothetical protein
MIIMNDFKEYYRDAIVSKNVEIKLMTEKIEQLQNKLDDINNKSLVDVDFLTTEDIFRLRELQKRKKINEKPSK